MATQLRAGVDAAPGVRLGRGLFVAITSLLCLGLPDAALGQRGWTDPVSVVSAIVTSVDDARVAVDAGGTVTAVWVEYVPLIHVVKAARLTPGGVWSAPVALSNPLTGADATVGRVPDGRRPRGVDLGCGCVGLALRRRRRHLGVADLIVARAPRTPRRRPSIRQATRGRVDLDGSNRVEVARYAAGAGTWGAPVDLGAGWNVQVKTDAVGNAVAL